MREMIKMVVVLTVLSSLSGGLLAAIRDKTKDKIEYQQLVFVKGPAIKQILSGVSNDPIVDRFKVTDQETERSFFVGVFNGKPSAIAFESYGKGFGGDVGVMVGINVEKNQILGVGVTTHSETPGVGSKAKDDPKFAAQFAGMELKDAYKVKTDGGVVDAVSGATITSRAVCVAITDATAAYNRLKPEIENQLKQFPK